MKEFFSLSQTEYNWRIAIIDSADEMNESSSNAILKLLEEPPNKSIIILISHNYFSLKSTIISRCQKITLRPLNENEMGKFLSKEVKNQEEINLETQGIGNIFGYTGRDFDAESEFYFYPKSA